MIVAGIAPAVIGDMADMTGRRAVYLVTMGIYCVANVGLAVQSSWTALFLLRMLQSWCIVLFLFQNIFVAQEMVLIWV